MCISYNDFKAHWLTKAFAGVSSVPIKFSSSDALDRLKCDPNAIAVIPKIRNLEGVNILLELKLIFMGIYFYFLDIISL